MRNPFALPVAATVLASIVATSAMAAPASVRVLGQPVGSGAIQNDLEQPFFENFAERTGVNTQVRYSPVDTSGVSDAEGLRVLRNNLFGIVSLRLSQISGDEPTLLGFDLVGQNPTYEVARQNVDAYLPVADARLQERFNSKLLGVWPAGPQVIFCEPEINGLDDLRGKRVRVYDNILGNFMSGLGAAPVPLSFPETQQGIARGLVDCGVTGPSSANAAGWPEVTSYVYPLPVQMAMNGYAINLNVWNQYTEEEQAQLEAAFNELVDEIWAYSEELFEDASRCNTGGEPCVNGRAYSLTSMEVTEKDLQTVNEAVEATSLPNFIELCDRTNPSCSEDWKATVGANLGL
ncbi:ABC transporter substrate-binding protein [Halomonas sp. DQ26W]|uniref:TRAP transporter substrate-binding protein n=1 Tax=Halomonas sp. DQ26W TaxID=2282311 RepID=UPI000DF75A7F|nr:TRAP transporter substrate-binding protein [Halomonas sp. DQ26W]RDB42677.1 ABC transporter substrate-binding protein [Halomonas sp. DQ26W]